MVEPKKIDTTKVFTFSVIRIPPLEQLMEHKYRWADLPLEIKENLKTERSFLKNQKNLRAIKGNFYNLSSSGPDGKSDIVIEVTYSELAYTI